MYIYIAKLVCKFVSMILLDDFCLKPEMLWINSRTTKTAAQIFKTWVRLKYSTQLNPLKLNSVIRASETDRKTDKERIK